MEKPFPLLFERKELCCGCGACAAVCPRDALTMAEDEEGFAYPVLNEAACIRCYRCREVCPVKKAEAGD